MSKIVQGMTPTRIYEVGMIAALLAILINEIQRSLGNTHVAIHIVLVGLAGFGALSVILAMVMGKRYSFSFTTVGFLTSFLLWHLGVIFDWQTSFSGPLSTWPIYTLPRFYAIPGGLFIDFLVWASKPHRNQADGDTALRDSRSEPNHDTS